MEEAPKDKVSNVEECVVLKDFGDAFKDISRFPLKRDIDLSINLVSRAVPVSKTPYRMSTPDLKEL